MWLVGCSLWGVTGMNEAGGAAHKQGLVPREVV